MIGKLVLVRTFSAGVHIGTLESRDGKEVMLTNARRLWYWKGAFTLSAVAMNGINSEESRMSVVVSQILLTEAIEIMLVSDAAKETYDATKAE